jgi:hypothetical protein
MKKLTEYNNPVIVNKGLSSSFSVLGYKHTGKLKILAGILIVCAIILAFQVSIEQGWIII